MLGAIGDRCARIVVERAKQSGLESPEVVVQGVDHNAERDVALELGCAPVKHQSAALLSADAKLCQQPGLADPGSPTSWTNHGSRNPNRAPLKLGDFTPGRPACATAVVLWSSWLVPGPGLSAHTTLKPGRGGSERRGIRATIDARERRVAVRQLRLEPCHGVAPWQGFAFVSGSRPACQPFCRPRRTVFRVPVRDDTTRSGLSAIRLGPQYP
jgi:hypothetical protein